MNWVLLAGGATLLLVPWALSRVSVHFTAASLVNLNRVAATTGYALFLFGLVATAAPRLLRELGLTQFAVICERIFGHIAPSHPAVAVVAGVASMHLMWSAVGATVDLRERLARVRIEPELGRHFRLRGLSLVLVPGSRPLAYAVPGRRPQIVVAAGWWRTLAAPDRRVVLAHELGHITLRHRFDLVLMGAMTRAFGWSPAIEIGIDHWQQAMEQSADDVAARRWGRTLVAQALSRVAVEGGAPALAFGSAASVAGRLEYLSRGRPARLAIYVAVGLVAAVAGSALASAAIWLIHAHGAIVGLIFCPV